MYVKKILEGKVIFEMWIRKIWENVPKLRHREYWDIEEIEKYWRIKNRDREEEYFNILKSRELVNISINVGRKIQARFNISPLE